jgi:hypothetical protein
MHGAPHMMCFSAVQHIDLPLESHILQSVDRAVAPRIYELERMVLQPLQLGVGNSITDLMRVSHLGTLP